MILLILLPEYVYYPPHRIRKNKNRGFPPGNSIQVPNIQRMRRNVAHFHLNMEGNICGFRLGDAHLNFLVLRELAGSQ